MSIAAALLVPVFAAAPAYQIESVRVRLTHYDQNGTGYQSAAGPPGTAGSERATIEQPQAEVVARLGEHVVQRLWVPIDVVSAASPDHSRYGKPIDAPDTVSTASATNVAGSLDTLTTYRWKADREVHFRAAFHLEEPFESWAFGVGATRSFADDSTIVGASLNQIVDWFDRFNIAGMRLGRASRSTSNANVTLSQVMSATTMLAVSYGATLQLGTLSNTWQSTLLSDGTRGEERLPRQRQRHAFSARLAQWLPWNGALKISARAYLDDWGIAAATAQADVSQRVSPWVYLRATYRIHRQRAADFFTTAADPAATGPRTGDSDLAAFVAQTVGGAVVIDVPMVAGPGITQDLRDVHIDFGYERYVRSNDLRVGITTCGVGFLF